MVASRIYFGTSQASPADDTNVIEKRTLSALEASSKTLTLANTPINDQSIFGNVRDGSIMTAPEDFSRAGAVINWSLGPYADALEEGDVIIFTYKKVL